MTTAETTRSLDARMLEFLDKAELRELVNRYARAVDRRDMDLLRSCYHPDAIDNHGVLFSGSAEEYIAWQPEIMNRFENSAHYIVNTLFAVDGDEAEGEVYFFGFHRMTEGEVRNEFIGGRYLDHYRRGEDGRWRFGQRDLVWDWYENRPAADEAMVFLRSLGDQGCGEVDVSKRILPLLETLKR